MRLEGKVAFITGAARGQGRTHAIRLAEEGADIIAVDICAPVPSVPYAMATEEDLNQTVKEVEARGRNIVARVGDVRTRDQLAQALAAGIEEFGRLDIVCANAGVMPMHETYLAEAWVDGLDIDLLGVHNTLAVSFPHLGEGASIIVTGSTAGMIPGLTDNPALGFGGAAYTWSKRTIANYVEVLALHLAPKFIRINGIHPTNCNTPLLHHDITYQAFRPDLENPTREDAIPAFTMMQAMPVPYIEPEDMSAMVAFLASDDSRYVTGQNLRVDAGSMLKSGIPIGASTTVR
jgi:SDR family mycofactocin-dependent oxidoreductase